MLIRSGEKVRADSLQNDLIPAFLYSCSLRISLLSSNSTAGQNTLFYVCHTSTYLPKKESSGTVSKLALAKIKRRASGVCSRSSGDAAQVNGGRTGRILTRVALDEFVVFHRSHHSGESPHGVVQLLHFLRVAPLQHLRRGEKQTNTKEQNGRRM